MINYSIQKLFNNPIASFKYWFVRDTQDTFNIYMMEQPDTLEDVADACQYHIGSIVFNSRSCAESVQDYMYMYDDFKDVANLDEIEEAFSVYMDTRPEYLVGQSFDTDFIDVKDMQDYYEWLLLGTALIRFKKSHDYCTAESEKSFIERFQTTVVSWLRDTDFYTAPASTIYHESYASGLLHHSLKVVNEIFTLSTHTKFLSVPLESAALVALTHDWCKIHLYTTEYRNAKNDEGVWEKVPYYKRRNEPLMPLGHGVLSMYLVSQFFKLTLEESCAIRHHMGVWNCHEAEYNDLQAANHRYPIVHMLQFADQLACVDY